jgi:hypothetical protein
LGVHESECGGVKRVLRDGDHDARVLVGANDVEKGIDARRGTSRQVDLGRVGREAITTCGVLLVILLDTSIHARHGNE